MVTDAQVRRLMMLLQSDESMGMAAAKAGMDEKTARKYRDAQALPSQLRREHDWRTRVDPFEEIWPRIEGYLEINAGLEAKTVFEHLQRQEPGRYADGQLRTLQRRFRVWRVLSGPAREVFFPQQHYPGQLGESDFTDLSSLGVTLEGRAFEHLAYHFVLTYSNWEDVTVCFSESFEALSSGLQNAFWTLGGVPQAHRTDCLSAAVHHLDQPEAFTERYRALLRHYRVEPERTNPASPHENGDVEQRHWRFTRALDQALMLRGSRDFAARADYTAFLQDLLRQLNAGRRARLAEEQAQLGALPAQRCEDYTRLEIQVSRFSTIRVQRNTYSVHSRLIGARLRVDLHADYLELRYAQQVLECLPRLRGHGGHRIDYRHVIDWLVRKPGAFVHYRYRDELFPTTCFRRAYDQLCQEHSPEVATRHYLELLHLAAQRSQDQVEALLEQRLASSQPLSADAVAALLPTGPTPSRRAEALRISVAPVDLRQYDALLSAPAVAAEAAG